MGAKSPTETIKQFKWTEVHKHNAANDCWIVVKGKVYDVTSWVPKHPGGSIIMTGAGRESTAMFMSYHPLHVEKMLAPYEIGSVEDYHPYYTWDSDFYTKMKRKVEEHFKAKGITGSDSPLLYLKSLFIVAGWLLFYYLAMIKGYTLAALFLGVFHSQFGIGIQHDANHGSYSYKRQWLQKLGSWAMDFMGGSSLVWLHQHNIGHHPYANREGGFYNEDYDPDSTSAFPILRTHPNQPWKPHIQFQHLYSWFLIPFSGAKWSIGDVKWMIKQRYNAIDFFKVTSTQVLEMIIFKTIFIFYSLVVPFSLLPFPRAFINVMIFVMTNGLLFILNFAVNHLLEDNIFPDGDSKERDWAKLQVLTASNYATDSTFWTLFSGGLNHQIEHHLFPGVSHIYLPEIAPIVQQTCKEFGVHYTNKPTYTAAVISYYKFLKNMARNPDEKPSKKKQ